MVTCRNVSALNEGKVENILMHRETQGRERGTCCACISD